MSETLKIGIVVPPLLKTPPTGYGGLEVVAYDLCVALAKSGQDVTLIAPKGSYAEGCKVIETIEAPEITECNWMQKEGEAFNLYKGELGKFDLIHDHSWHAFPYLARITEQFGKDLKICHTAHGHIDWNRAAVKPEVAPICLIGISAYMQMEFTTQGWPARYVYNGIDMTKYSYQKEKENRFVFVGRISKFKQPHLAIDAAVAAGVPVDIVGGSFVDDKMYLENIRKKCEMSGGMATLHLDASHEEKTKMVGRAKACMVPSAFNEPFGLTAVESIAQGTPVIALDDGALSELITPKVGKVCGSNEAFIQAAKDFEIGNCDPVDCRQRAEYFSREKMAERYMKVYREVIEGPGW